MPGETMEEKKVEAAPRDQGQPEEKSARPGGESQASSGGGDPGPPSAESTTREAREAGAVPTGATGEAGSPEKEGGSKAEGSDKIVKYDFLRPVSISKRFRQNLNTIGESLAKQLAFNLSNYLRTNVEVEFSNLEQSLFKDYLARLETPSCLGIFAAPPLKGHAVVAVEAGLMFVVLDKMIGGPGKPLEEVRDFTEIEIKIFTLVLRRILSDLKEASKKVISLEVSLSRVESNPGYINIMTGGERALIMELTVTIGEFSGKISLCFSLSGFDPVMDRLEPKEEVLEKRPEEVREEKERILSALQESTVELVAVLGNCTMRMSRLLELRVGDTIVLDQPASVPIKVKVGDAVVFRGEPGQSRNRRAVRVIDRTDREVESVA